MFHLIDMTEQHLEMVLNWRIAPEVRKNMYTTHEITLEEHSAWFAQVKDDPSKKYLLCLDDDVPVGAINFVSIDQKHRTAFWGFYSGDTSRRGVGSQMEFLALDYAFTQLGLQKLSCEVLSFNKEVISFHRKFGFKVEGLFKEHILTEEGYVDVYRLAMDAGTWKRQRPVFEAKLQGEKGPDNPAVSVGKSHTEALTLSVEDIARFSDLSGDTNPIHLDVQAAQAAGFSGVVCHGMFAASIFSRIFGTSFPGPGTIYLQQSLAFTKPVLAGMACKATVRVLSKVGRRLQLETVLVDEAGAPLLSGEAELLIPKHLA